MDAFARTAEIGCAYVVMMMKAPKSVFCTSGWHWKMELYMSQQSILSGCIMSRKTSRRSAAALGLFSIRNGRACFGANIEDNVMSRINHLRNRHGNA